MRSPLKGVIANFGSLIFLTVLGTGVVVSNAELGTESNELVGSLCSLTRGASLSLLNTPDCSMSLIVLCSDLSSPRISVSSASSLVRFSCKLILIATNRVASEESVAKVPTSSSNVLVADRLWPPQILLFVPVSVMLLHYVRSEVDFYITDYASSLVQLEWIVVNDGVFSSRVSAPCRYS